eukprot:c8742_g1_i1.p2 GENE.c8742_g1_i1~~c8742_g1_i1.p2  ORF type:complete len:155 (+),score=48.62 c8742_g1_i1:705-1169(+)
MWSVGVILHILLVGFPPFYNDNNEMLFQSIKECRVDYTTVFWEHISACARDFVCGLLVADPNRRFTATQALHHPWMTMDLEHEVLEPNLELFKQFNAKRKFRKMARVAMAGLKLKSLARMSQEKVRRLDDENTTDTDTDKNNRNSNENANAAAV